MQWSTTHGGWFFVLVAAAFAAVLWSARRAATSPSARAWSLFFLRSAVLAVLLAIVAKPVQVSETRDPPRVPSAIQLFDASRSMSLESPLSRLARGEQILFDAQQQLPQGHQVRLQRFAFGEQLSPLAGAWQATADQSKLLEALESLPGRFGADLPLGVFVFSDGRSTQPLNPDDVRSLAEGYRQVGVPLHVVPLGEAAGAGDVAIRDLVSPRDVPPGTRVSVKVVVGSFGHKGERAEIQIRAASAPQGPPLATLPITLDDADQTFDLTIEADRVQGQMLVEVPPLPREAFVQNNRVSVPLHTRNPKIRVIYMEGTLGNEYRWIRDALVEDPNIECLAIEVNAQYAQSPTLHRVTDPGQGFPTTREELFQYDVVICSDINRVSFTQDQLDWVVELVGQRGGGFVMIGGNTSFGAGGWDQTVWDGLIPVDMSGRDRGYGTIWNVFFKPSVPVEAASHPVWRIVEDPAANQQILRNIPPLYGTNRTDRVKPGATILAYSDQPISDAGIMPIVTSQAFGKGRTFAFSPDSTVDWGRDFERLWGEGDNRYFRKFWRNVVRWLSENSAGRNRRLTIDTDKFLYRPGEPIHISAQAYDEDQRLASGYRLVSRLLPGAGEPPGQPPPTPLTGDELLSLRPDLVHEGQFETPALARLAATGAAATREVSVEVTAFRGTEIVARGTTPVQVIDDSPEFRDARPDLETLEQLAAASGGKVIRSGSDLASVLKTYKTVPGETIVSRVPLWDRLPVWLLIVGLLSAEWIIRRATGLA